jgi:hypothetical protein
MIYALALLTTAALTDPASPPNPAPATEIAPDKISYRGIGNGWTGGGTTWWIDRSGRGHYETTERGQRISKRLNVGVEGYERLRDILQPLESLEAIPCQGVWATDQPHGSLSWERGPQTAKLDLSFGCADANMANVEARFGEANALLIQWSTRAR